MTIINEVYWNNSPSVGDKLRKLLFRVAISFIKIKVVFEIKAKNYVIQIDLICFIFVAGFAYEKAA